MVFLYIKKITLKTLETCLRSTKSRLKINYTHRLTNLVVPKYPILHIPKQIVVNKFILEILIVKQLSTV